MKKLLFALGILIMSLGIYAQAPQSFKYQAVLRDASGNILTDTNVGLQISILEDSETGNPVYIETWNVTTNDFGLFSLNIGEGTVESGDFASIDWGNHNYWIKTAVDETGGTNYVDIGTSKLLSVPYAVYANESANGSSQWLNNNSSIYYNDGNV